jgi:hypothetical protein
MRLSADLIPHEDFHKGYWLKENKCPWFFFYETPREYSIPKNKKFYSTLDDDLKDLVQFFHSKNIPTTPSCSGHIHDDEHYHKIYSSLMDTANNIKTGGVELVNPETNKKFYYQNPKYKLPISNDSFVEQLRDYQKKGVLGFVDDFKFYDKLKKEIPVEKSGNITLIKTEGKTPKQISRNWKNIGKVIKGLY